MAKRRRVLVAVIAAAAAFGIAGGIYASIPSSGVINGCYKKNGELRVVDPSAGGACKKDETALDWNQTGPTGPTGAQGPPGPSDLWEAKVGVTPLPETDLVDPNTYLPLPVMASLSLPAGSYLVSSTIYLLDFDNPAGFICYLDGPSGHILHQGQASNYQADEPASITLQSAVTLASPATVALHCASNGTDSLASDGRLDALKVGTVH